MQTFSLTMLVALGAALVGCGAKPWVVIEQAQPNPFIGKSRFYVEPMDYEGLRIGSKSEEEYVSDKKDESAASFEEDKEAVADRFYENLVQSARSRGVKVKARSAKKAASLSAREMLLGRLPQREEARPFLLVQDAAGAPASEPPPAAETDDAPAEPKERKTAADDEFDEGEGEGVAEGPFVIKPNIDFMEPGFYAFVAKQPSTITLNVQISDSGGKLLDEIEITQSWSASMVDAASGTRYRKIADQLGRITGEYLEYRTTPPEE